MSNLIDQLRETAWARSSKLEMEAADRIAELEREVQHWKANHDNMVAKNALLSQRPDLPVDRIPAMRRLDELERQNAELQQKLADFTKGVSVKIPTVTMEQEFQAHYRSGFEARKLAASEPVLYQARMRPNWLPAGEGWTEWKNCSRESYEDQEKLSKLPHYNSWEYEVRKLYAAPQPQAAQSEESLNAARYRIAREHIAPAFFAKSMGTPFQDIEPSESIGERIDELCDIALAQAGKEGA